MQFTTLSLTLAAIVSAALAVRVTYDPVYDNESQSLNTVACSDGKNGLITKGYSTFGDLPTFPNIGGAHVVEGWNSTQCGSCWQLTYNGKNIIVTAIDHTNTGFNIGPTAMQSLTGSPTGMVENAQAKQLDRSACGL